MAVKAVDQGFGNVISQVESRRVGNMKNLIGSVKRDQYWPGITLEGIAKNVHHFLRPCMVTPKSFTKPSLRP